MTYVLKNTSYVDGNFRKSLSLPEHNPHGLEERLQKTDSSGARLTNVVQRSPHSGTKTQRKDGSKLGSLRHEFLQSELTKEDFASDVGVDLSRFEYWIQFEECRSKIRLDQQSKSPPVDGEPLTRP